MVWQRNYIYHICRLSIKLLHLPIGRVGCPLNIFFVVFGGRGKRMKRIVGSALLKLHPCVECALQRKNWIFLKDFRGAWLYMYACLLACCADFRVAIRHSFIVNLIWLWLSTHGILTLMPVIIPLIYRSAIKIQKRIRIFIAKRCVIRRRKYRRAAVVIQTRMRVVSVDYSAPFVVVLYLTEDKSSHRFLQRTRFCVFECEGMHGSISLLHESRRLFADA
jgi:hypothetical protein